MADPKDLSRIKVPLAYVVYQYRQKFHLSHEDMENEPFDVFHANLEIMHLEAKAQEASQKGGK